MREPKDTEGTIGDYINWAKENKKRADRLLRAAKDVAMLNHGDWVAGLDALEAAAIDYEDRVG